MLLERSSNYLLDDKIGVNQIESFEPSCFATTAGQFTPEKKEICIQSFKFDLE